MRTIGRLIMLGVGIALIAIAIPSIIDAVNQLNASGWDDITKYQEKLAHLVVIITNGFSALSGAYAIWVSITGKAGFLPTLVAAIILGINIWSLVTNIQAGKITDFLTILSTIGGFVLPLLYFVGSILTSVGSRKA